MDKKTIHKKGSWLLKETRSPLPHHKHHFILPLVKHTSNISDISKKDWETLGSLLIWTTQKFSIPGGGIVLKFGNPTYNESPVKHIYAEIHVPNLDGGAVRAIFLGEEPKPICKATSAKGEEKIEADKKRAAEFKKK